MLGNNVSEEQTSAPPKPPDVFLVGDDGNIRRQVSHEVVRCVMCNAVGYIDTSDCNRRCGWCGYSEGCEG